MSCELLKNYIDSFVYGVGVFFCLLIFSGTLIAIFTKFIEARE